MSELRPRQSKAINDISRTFANGYNSPTLVAATGFGKTHTAATLIRRALAKGKRVWFLAHLKQILKDTSGRLSKEGIPHGWIAADMVTDRRQGVQMVMIQTLINRLDTHDPPDLLIVDEAHLAVANTYQEIFKWAKAGPKYYVKGGSFLLHLTATPIRLDGRGMGEVSDKLILTCSTQDLIDEGLLSPIKYFAPSPPDLSGVKTSMGDYSQAQLADVMDKPKITGSAVAEYSKVARWRPAIVFCVTIKHAEHVCDEFRSQGYRATFVHAGTSDEERTAALNGVRTGLFDAVCNVGLWIAGVDAPEVSCIILLAPTKSLVKYLQSIGRGLRTSPNKDCCVILDHAGNLARHGNPTMAREWTLSAGKQKKSKSENEISMKQCPSCFASVVSLATHCVCGHVFKPVEREIEIVDGHLEEIDLTAHIKAKRIEQGRAQSEEDLIALGRARGQKRPELWAKNVLLGRAKQKRRMES